MVLNVLGIAIISEIEVRTLLRIQAQAKTDQYLHPSARRHHPYMDCHVSGSYPAVPRFTGLNPHF